ncbi:MAG: NUDIX hydrolase [Magnetococcales bacterium]|nr:NUDIX hydrolase [Magnetococcales bacterium]
MIVRPSGLVVRKGRLLTMRYRYGGQERFNLPGGNHDPGESAASCLIREFAEELGMEVLQLGDLLWVAETAAGGREVMHLVYDIPDCCGEALPNPDHTKALEAVWLPLEALESAPLYPALGKNLIRWMQNHDSGTVYLGRLPQPWFD